MELWNWNNNGNMKKLLKATKQDPFQRLFPTRITISLQRVNLCLERWKPSVSFGKKKKIRKEKNNEKKKK